MNKEKESVENFKAENHESKQTNEVVDQLLKAINEMDFKKIENTKVDIEEVKSVLKNQQKSSHNKTLSSNATFQQEAIAKLPHSTAASVTMKKFDFIAFLEVYFNENAQFRENWIKTNIHDNTLVPFFENMFASFRNILITSDGKECAEVLTLIEKCMQNPWFQQPFSIAYTQYKSNNVIAATKSKTTSLDIFKEMIKTVIWKDWEKLSPIIDEIFNRLFQKPSLAHFFAALFIASSEIENAMEKDNFKAQIHMGVLIKIHAIIDKNTMIENSPDKNNEDLQKEEDEEKDKLLKDTMHKQLFGTLKLATDLFKNNFINFKICECLITALLQNAETTGNEVMYENVVEFMKDIGRIQRNADLDVHIKRLENQLTKVSGKVGIKILELMSLRDKHWIQEEAKRI